MKAPALHFSLTAKAAKGIISRLESIVKIRQQKERVSGCGMQKQVSYASSFSFHLFFLSFSLY
ncbi:MAG: hypothetical protein LBG98_01220 [Puniceicoccales bacterium]|nr:hypothetical protein [Puniceicoccales bacterium]